MIKKYGRFGMYNDPSDPRLIIPKRNPAFGWTINLGNKRAPLAWWTIMLVAAGAVGLAVAAKALTNA